MPKRVRRVRPSAADRPRPVSPESSPKPARARSVPRAKTPPPISVPELSPSLIVADKSTVMPQSRPPLSGSRLGQRKPSGGRRERRPRSRSRASSSRTVPTVPVQPTVNSCVTDRPIVSRLQNKYNGVWHDLFSITNAYEHTGSKSFKDFMMLCEEKKVMEIFRGIPHLRFLLEFTETVMLRCKEMWLEITPLDKQVGWFYLLCAMYLYQPKALLSLSNGVQIRLVESDHGAICKFVLQTRSREIEDVDLMMQVLHGKLAFVSGLTSLTYGLEKMFTQCFVEDTEKAEFKKQCVLFPRLTYSLQESFSQLDNQLRDYCSAKEKLLSLSMELDRGRRNDLVEGLSALKPNFVDELVLCLPPDMKTDIRLTSVET